MSESKPNSFKRSDVLNLVFEERPKHMAVAWTALGGCRKAEKVFRELMVAIEKQQERIGGEAALEEWCWKAISNRCAILARRDQGRQVQLDGALLRHLDDELRFRDRQELSDQAAALRLCLSQLGERSRWILQLLYVEGHSGLEVARGMNVKPDHLYRDVQRIYTRLAKCLFERVAMGRAALGHVGDRNPAFEELVFRYMDDELTPQDALKLGSHLAENPARIRQFNDIRLFGALVRDNEVLQPAPNPSPPELPWKPPAERRWRAALALSIVMAGMIVISATGIFWLIKVPAPDPAPPVAAAQVLRGTDVKFQNRPAPQGGQDMSRGDYNLLRGTIGLRFAKGAEVNIEGPAQFTINSADEVELGKGTLLAMVPRPAIGFTVKTEFATIVDLGTEFGVSVRPNRSADVVVFEGKVEVTMSGQEPSLLEFGKGLHLTQSGSSDLKASREAYRYPRNLPISAPKRSAGNLLSNPSFEIGTLSRAPHSGHLYRDTPSAWSLGRLAKGRWITDLSPSKAGTLVSPSTTVLEISPPPHGERCLYLNGASARTRIGQLKPGTRYHLELSIASMPRYGHTTEYRVGLFSQNRWIDFKRGTLKAGANFTKVKFDLTIPADCKSVDKPLFLMLSATKGPLFLDDLHLKARSGG